MPASDQGVTDGRYVVVPRTLIFLRRNDSYLLIKGSQTKRLWAHKYNGIGGHVERGENILAAAARELNEETGFKARLWLCGTVIVDAGDIGVCLYVFSGQPMGGEIQPSEEGAVEWIPYSGMSNLPLVEDIPALISKIHTMREGDTPFAARSYYDQQGNLQVEFND